MKAFAALYDAIDATTATNEKVAALVDYFRAASPDEAAWAAALLLGRRPKRLVKAGDLRTWGAEAAAVPSWLFEECYAQAGDLAETIALLAADGPDMDEDNRSRHDDGGDSLAWWMESRLLPLAAMPVDAQREVLHEAWRALSGSARFVFNKLLTGGFRVGVSDGLVVRALAQISGLSTDTVQHRLMGQWEPSAAWYTGLLQPEDADEQWSRPYPFFLAHPLTGGPDTLGVVEDWQVEWKWDGIRCQLVKRNGRVLLWSRGEELLVGRFPEVEASANWMPDGTVLDGELLAWREGVPLPFTALQRRINRKTVGRTLLRDVPCHLLVYDCLESDGHDVRSAPLHARRALAESAVMALPSGASIGMSPVVAAHSWQSVTNARDAARTQQAEGLMIKHRCSAYGVGRKVGDWWKWKVDPLRVDAVLVYAQAGHGRRAGLYTDYTFAIWDGDALVPFAKAYSGLTDSEIREVDRFIRANTLEKFGPVRTVQPELVFELAFEGIQHSRRHKSGIAVRFPRIARWRRDKTAAEADRLDTVRALVSV
jgi:DNA ligase-1